MSDAYDVSGYHLVQGAAPPYETRVQYVGSFHLPIKPEFRAAVDEAMLHASGRFRELLAEMTGPSPVLLRAALEAEPSRHPCARGNRRDGL